MLTPVFIHLPQKNQRAVQQIYPFIHYSNVFFTKNEQETSDVTKLPSLTAKFTAITIAV